MRNILRIFSRFSSFFLTNVFLLVLLELKYRFSGLKFHDRTLNAHTSSMNLDAHTEFEEREWKEARFDPFQPFREYFLSSFTRGHPPRPKAEPQIRNS